MTGNFVYLESLDGIPSIKLNRPEYGNVLRLDMTRINRRSRGGDLIVFREESWPKTKTLVLTFAWISDNSKRLLLKFFKDYLGQKVRYIDHLGFTWEGFIMTPAAQIIQNSRNDKNVSIEFQGEKV